MIAALTFGLLAAGAIVGIAALIACLRTVSVEDPHDYAADDVPPALDEKSKIETLCLVAGWCIPMAVWL